jgi:putative acyl-CoA dehydrogenase
MHWMLRLGVERELNSLPWREPGPGAHVVRAALFHLFNQLDTGPCCPMSINYAAVPTMRQDPTLAERWERRLTLPDYDAFAQAGMAFTEKQGGSDLRANSTVAEPIGDGWFELTGHKWFCTHPVFDVFFTLAQTEAGITCFVAERPHPGFRIQRLKDKLGGRCLASSEVEYDHLPAQRLGEEGRGTAFVVEQLIWTRLDTLLGVTGMMRRLVAEAVWHARHRAAFGAPLSQQPAMVNVLADLALESEAATAATMRLARAFDSERPEEVAFRRLALAVMKYWVCKRGAPLAAEALECLGGNGYVEEAPMAQFYRDIQIGTVWEGSGNVIALDVLRALAREPEGAPALLAECDLASGANAHFDAHMQHVREGLADLAADPTQAQWGARRVVEDMALALQASLLLRNAPAAVSDAFCAARLGARGLAFGDLPRGVDGPAIVERALAL